MAATAREQFGRRFNGNGAEYVYWIAEATDEDDARTTLLAAAAATKEAGGTTLYLSIKDCEVYEASGMWYGRLAYIPQGEAIVTDSTSFEFDTSGGTQHLMASYATTQAYPAGTAATTDNNGLIGATKDGVEGVDVAVGRMCFSITKAKAISLFDATYLDTLADMVGKTNDETFSGSIDDGVAFSYAAGEALFLGARGGVRDGRAVVTYLFAAGQNVDDDPGLSVGSIGGIEKKAWEYLWATYKDTVANNMPVKKAARVYVEQVHREGDFSALACT